MHRLNGHQRVVAVLGRLALVILRLSRHRVGKGIPSHTRMALVQRALIGRTRGNHASGRTATLPVQIPVDRIHQAGQSHRIRPLGRVRHPDGVHHRTPRLLQLLRTDILGHQYAGRLRVGQDRHRKAVALRQRGIRIRRHRCRYRYRVHYRGITERAVHRLNVTAAVGGTHCQRATRSTITHTVQAAAHLVVIQRRQDQIRVARVHHPNAIRHVAARLRYLTRRTGLLYGQFRIKGLSQDGHQRIVAVLGRLALVILRLSRHRVGKGIPSHTRMALVQRALIGRTRGNHASGRTATLPVQIPVDRIHQAGQSHRIRPLGRVRHPDGVHHRTPRLLQLLRTDILGHQYAGRLRVGQDRHRKAVALRQRGIRIRRHRCRYRYRVHYRGITERAVHRLNVTAAVGGTHCQRATRSTITHTVQAAAHLVVIQRRQDQIRVARVHHPNAIRHVAARLRNLGRRAGFFNGDGRQQGLGHYSHQSVIRGRGSGPFVVDGLGRQGIGEGITGYSRVRDQEFALVLPTRGDSNAQLTGGLGQCRDIPISGISQ